MLARIFYVYFSCEQTLDHFLGEFEYLFVESKFLSITHISIWRFFLALNWCDQQIRSYASNNSIAKSQNT